MLAQTFYQQYLQPHKLVDENLLLQLEGFNIALRSNSEALLARLEGYFGHCLGSGTADVEVVCLDSQVIQTGLPFTDWQREAGKTGRKDAYYDLANGRLILKVRTGMLFLQSQQHLMVLGPCLENDNQVINFINAQYMNYLQNQGALICHAAAIELHNRALAFAGFSGGGKSTLMLHLLALDHTAFISNDRLFLSQYSDHLKATGIPKLPRVNPGTLLNDDRLRSILAPETIEVLLNMPKDELWHLEQKYDVDIDAVYGIGKISSSNQLAALVILNWHFDNDSDCQIQPVDLGQRPELVAAVMKSPGPFYQLRDGAFYNDQQLPQAADYLTVLEAVEVFEVTGGVDFEYARDFFYQYMSSIKGD